MNIFKLSAIVGAAALMIGCASDDYKMYAEGQSKIEAAKYLAEAERWKAMSNIAANGTESAKIAAVVAMAMSGQGSAGGSSTQMQGPRPNEALQWASLIVPSVTQLAGISANMRLGIAQSDNAFKASVSLNETFLGIAGKIQAPAAPVVPAANVTTTNTYTLAGTGTIGSGTYSTVANPTTTTTNANPTTTTTTTTPTTTITCTGNTVTTGNNGCPPGP